MVRPKWYYNTEVPLCISDGKDSYCLVQKKRFRDINYELVLGSNDLLDKLNEQDAKIKELEHRIRELTGSD